MNADQSGHDGATDSPPPRGPGGTLALLESLAPSLVGSLGIGLIAFSPAGRALEVNHKASSMFGLDLESARRASFDDFFQTPPLRDAFASLLTLPPGHRTPSEEVALTVHGKRYWANVWFKSLSGEAAAETRYVVAVIEDATSTKKEFELIDSISRRLTTILDIDRLLPEIVKLLKESFRFYNVNIGLVEGDYIVVKAGYGGYWGKPDQALRGKIKLRVGQEGVIGRVAATNQPFLVSDASKEPAFFYFPPLGESISEVAVPIASKDRVIGVLDVQSNKVGGVTLRDMKILQALASQISVAIENASLWAEIKRSREQYADLYENAPDLYMSVNREGIVTRCNRTQAETLGMPKTEIIGRQFLELFDPADRKKVWESVFGSEDDGHTPRTVDGRMMHKTGLSVYVSVSSRVLRDPSGKPLTARIVAKDVTEKKKLETQFMHAQKMESLGKLAGGIAHDFNNLLGSILGFTSYLKTLVEEGEVKSCLDVIEESIERGTEITDRLLSFARAKTGGLSRVNVGKIVDDTVRLLERSIDKSIRIEKKVASDLRTLLCDPGQIQQILMNLCLNARDAMPEGGRLTVAARNLSRREIVQMVPNADAQVPYVGIVVEDTGVGIPPEDEIRIFEPFYTTKRKGSATGLGLSVTYSLVKKYDGYINIKSALGEGSTLTIILPVKKTTAIQTKPTRRRPTGGDETVLIVDDEKTIRKFTNLSLLKLGYKVLEAANGQEAVDIFREQKDKIRLVILDLMMPVMNGEEAFERIVRLQPDARFIISTGYATDRAAKDILKSPRAALLPKPYNVKQLSEAVRDMLDKVIEEE
jgi:PAS domain S-box-containing protein